MANCINCENEVSDLYCPHCSQRTNVKRITFREGWYDFWARIYGFDGMFPRMLRDLTMRPGKAARTFIEGNRVKYYGPVGYFFLMATVFLLLLDMLNIDGAQFFQQMGTTGVGPTIEKGSAQEQVTNKMFRFMSDNMKIIFFAMIPFQAFMARYLFFRKSGLNYVENSVMPLYTAGHIYWISILSVIYYKITGVFLRNSIGTVVSTIYIGYAYMDFFSYQPKWKAFIKGIFTYYFSLFAFILFGTLIAISLVILFPEVRAFFRPIK